MRSFLDGGAAKKALRPAEKRSMVADLQTGFRVSARRACEVVHLNRSTLSYRPHAPDQTLLRMRLRDLAAARVRSV